MVAPVCGCLFLSSTFALQRLAEWLLRRQWFRGDGLKLELIQTFSGTCMRSFLGFGSNSPLGKQHLPYRNIVSGPDPPVAYLWFYAIYWACVSWVSLIWMDTKPQWLSLIYLGLALYLPSLAKWNQLPLPWNRLCSSEMSQSCPSSLWVSLKVQKLANTTWLGIFKSFLPMSFNYAVKSKSLLAHLLQHICCSAKT